MIGLFVGIAAGVLLGSLPLSIVGVPVPIHLGLAGGPLLVALGLSHLGRLGRMSFHLPNSAGLMLRQLGIVLFLGSVGLMSGESFVRALVHGQGLRSMAIGAGVTLLPLLAAELIARVALNLYDGLRRGVPAGDGAPDRHRTAARGPLDRGPARLNLRPAQVLRAGARSLRTRGFSLVKAQFLSSAIFVTRCSTAENQRRLLV